MGVPIHQHWDNLFIADTTRDVFKNTTVSEFNKDKWKPDGSVFHFVTCMRQSLMAPESSKFPVTWQNNEKVAIHQGKEAYRFLLNYFTGLDAIKRQKGRLHPDIHASGDMRRAWNKFRKKSPTKSKALMPFVDATFHDGNLIKQAILSHAEHQPTFSNAALDLANLNPTKTALIVGDDPGPVLKLVTAFGHGKQNHPGKILVSMRDEAASYELLKKVVALPRHRAVSAPIEVIANTDPLPVSSALLVAPARKGQEDAYAAWWSARQLPQVETAVYLTNTKPVHAGNSETANFSLNDVYAKQKDAVAHTTKITGVAQDAIDRIVELRAQGDRVVALNFNLQLADFNFVIARRPKGAPDASPADSEPRQ